MKFWELSGALQWKKNINKMKSHLILILVGKLLNFRNALLKSKEQF